MRGTVVAVAACCIAFGAQAARRIDVQSGDNIYGAGQITPPGGPGHGQLPEIIPLTTADLCVVFTKVRGSRPCASSELCVSLNNGENFNDPDGIGGQQSPTSNTGYRAISGIKAPGEGYLVGVFVPSGGPTGAAPAALDFTTGKKTGFKTLAPVLDQTFFFGDGRTGNGEGHAQRFSVPSGAGYLALGVSDTCDGGNGSPGCYRDNVGHFQVHYLVFQTACDAADRPRSAP